MNEFNIPIECHFTACASLAALGVQLKHLNLFGPIQEAVHIAQKTVNHSPTDKLYDAFISLLAGSHGLVEINSRLRADPALQVAFGRSRCAEQSVVQDTLNMCTAKNVKQMEQAMDTSPVSPTFWAQPWAAECRSLAPNLGTYISYPSESDGQMSLERTFSTG